MIHCESQKIDSGQHDQFNVNLTLCMRTFTDLRLQQCMRTIKKISIVIRNIKRITLWCKTVVIILLVVDLHDPLRHVMLCWYYLRNPLLCPLLGFREVQPLLCCWDHVLCFK